MQSKNDTIYARSYSFPHKEHERLMVESRKMGLGSRSARALQLLSLGRAAESDAKADAKRKQKARQ